MMSCLKSPETRRCRPLLGTYVEITVFRPGEDPEFNPSKVIEVGFKEIERIQNKFNFHDPQSEISRINKNAGNGAVEISEEAFHLIQRSLEISCVSDGAFDIVAGVGSWKDIQLSKNIISFKAPLQIDLGGIAKGYAVDCALKLLRESGVASAIVNAGGDLKTMGEDEIEVHLRNPSIPTEFCHELKLKNAALATSSPCFSRSDSHGRLISHLRNRIMDGYITENISISVKASECWLADALTKVVLTMQGEAANILALYGAEAFIINVR